MDIFLRTNKSLKKMKDSLNIERGTYLTNSSIDGKKETIAEYSNEQKALEILDRIDRILDKAIENNANAVSIRIPSDK